MIVLYLILKTVRSYLRRSRQNTRTCRTDGQISRSYRMM